VAFPAINNESFHRKPKPDDNFDRGP